MVPDSESQVTPIIDKYIVERGGNTTEPRQGHPKPLIQTRLEIDKIFPRARPGSGRTNPMVVHDVNIDDVSTHTSKDISSDEEMSEDENNQ